MRSALRATQLLAVAVSVLVATTWGCWSTDYARDSMASPPDRPRPGGGADATLEQTPPGMPTSVATPTGPVTSLATSEHQLSILPGPVAVNLRKNAPRTRLLADRAVVRIDLPAGYRHGLPGLAELSALAVADAADGAGNRPPLRRVIAGLGGELDFQVGASWTRFSATLPTNNWEPALQAMAERINRAPLDRAQFVDLQDRLIRSHLESWMRQPVLSQASQWLQYGTRSRQQIIEAIEDRSLPELVLFQHRHHQPRGAAVGLWMPDAPEAPSFLLERCKTLLLGWKAGPLPPQAVPDQAATTPVGAQWIEGDAVDDGEPMAPVALILPRAPATPEWSTLIEAFTMGGLGGRLGRFTTRQLGQEPVFQMHGIGNYGERNIVLETLVPRADIPRFWAAAQAAWRSLQAAPPVADELRDAIARARLRFMRRQDHADSWFEAVGLRLLGRQPGGPATDIESVLRIDAAAIAAAAQDLAKHPLAMVVLGGPMPAGIGTEFKRVSGAVPAYRRSATETVAGAEAKAQEYLRLAILALGERRALLTFTGYRSSEILTDSEGLAVSVHNVYQHPSQLLRTTHVLSTEIRTQIGGGKSEETVADETRKLSAGEADALLGECARHPIALLAGVVRGELRFRFLGLRTRAGRRVALLERVDDSRPRLRIGIEVGSGLLRTVETVLRRPGVGLVQVLDGYDDYRSAGALRVPMHRVTTVDGGSGGVESTYEKFEILDR